jgi:hypothetical protein
MPEQLDRLSQQFRTDRRAKRNDRFRTRPPKPSLYRRPHRDSPSDPIALVQRHARHFEKSAGALREARPLRPDLKVLRSLALACAERSDVLHPREAPRFADALLALSAHWRDWLRPLDEWVPPSAEAAVQFGSLARHLLARHDVPQFLDAAWYEGPTVEGVRQQNWFRLVGSGQSIRDAPDLPLALTRSMTHHFLHTPPGFDVMSAFRRAWVLGLGGTEDLARALLATRLCTDFAGTDFWETVLRWLTEHPNVSPARCGPLIEYIHNQRFVPTVPVPFVPGHPRFVPAQPNLCMKGRTPESLLRAVGEWQRQQLRARYPASSWKPSGLPPLVTVVPDAVGVSHTYAITELISVAELDEEGKALNHCVGGYAGACRSGEVSIWSLTVRDAFGRFERLLTLEVRTFRREIVQARGRYNRLPHPEEVPVLARWAAAGGPALVTM